MLLVSNVLFIHGRDLLFEEWGIILILKPFLPVVLFSAFSFLVFSLVVFFAWYKSRDLGSSVAFL